MLLEGTTIEGVALEAWVWVEALSFEVIQWRTSTEKRTEECFVSETARRAGMGTR